jgi:hypothetical protein
MGLGVKRVFVILVLIYSATIPSFVIAQEEVQESEGSYVAELRRKFILGLAAGYFIFDTNFKFANKTNGRILFIDAEGTLGLPETELTPMIYGVYRPSKRHGFGFGYFGIRRETNLLAIDENLGDINVTGDVFLSDRTRFLTLAYNLTVFEDDRANIFASFGVNAIDLRYQVVAEGNVTIGGQPVRDGRHEEVINQFAPLPLIGIDAWFAVTPKWAIGSKIALVAGKYDEVSGAAFEVRVRTRYSFNKRLGAVFGVNYFDARINVDKQDKRTEITYGFDGIYAGLDISFGKGPRR